MQLAHNHTASNYAIWVHTQDCLFHAVGGQGQRKALGAVVQRFLEASLCSGCFRDTLETCY